MNVLWQFSGEFDLCWSQSKLSALPLAWWLLISYFLEQCLKAISQGRHYSRWGWGDFPNPSLSSKQENAPATIGIYMLALHVHQTPL